MGGYLNKDEYSLSKGAVWRMHHHVLTIDEYYYNQTLIPFDVLDEKGICA